MALLDKFNALRQASAAVISDIGLLPFGVGFDAILSPTEAVWRGRRVVMLGSNNYLGMTHDPDCVDTARRALDDWGRGSTGARPASGTFSLHRALEQDIAAFFGVDHAMLFTTGYQANLGIIGTLCGHGDTVVLDRDSHASTNPRRCPQSALPLSDIKSYVTTVRSASVRAWEGASVKTDAYSTCTSFA